MSLRWLWSNESYKVGKKQRWGANHSDGKVAIVTGANSGIGRETALELARTGATVILACRNVASAEETADYIRREAPGAAVKSLLLDLSSCRSICTFAANFGKLYDLLHILLLNAGVMCCPRSETREGFELQLGVNHLGHMLLAALLLPALRRAAPSRVVVVSSYGQKYGCIRWEDLFWRTGYSPLKAYLQSKLANVLFMRALHRRLIGSGVTVNALHPGIVRTTLARHMYTTLGWLQAALITLLCQFSIVSPAEGCRASLYCALAPELQTTSGQYFSERCVPETLSANDTDAEAERLWSVSVQLLRDYLPQQFVDLPLLEP